MVPFPTPSFIWSCWPGGWETYNRFYNPRQAVPPNYYHITSGQRMATTDGYFGLIGDLLAAMALNGKLQEPPEELIHDNIVYKMTIHEEEPCHYIFTPKLILTNTTRLAKS